MRSRVLLFLRWRRQLLVLYYRTTLSLGLLRGLLLSAPFWSGVSNLALLLSRPTSLTGWLRLRGTLDLGWSGFWRLWLGCLGLSCLILFAFLLCLLLFSVLIGKHVD